MRKIYNHFHAAHLLDGAILYRMDDEKWKAKAPVEPGLYWVSDRGVPILCQVGFHNGRLQVLYHGGFVALRTFTQWYGPISPLMPAGGTP